jgi:flavin-dependent dehydrogenase
LHLALQLPQLSVAVLEPKPVPPRFTHKVGESSLGPQGSYLTRWLELEPYLNENHVEKFGARYFFGDSQGSFVERPEIGARHAAVQFPIPEYQVDRGKLEADLRQKLVGMGVSWLSYRATEVAFGQGDAPHILQLAGATAEEKRTLSARWVIDATGRRRFLHRLRHDHAAPSGQCSAAWFRVPGWVDVDDFVPATEQDWHQRVAPRHPRGIPFGRLNSTNHLCGKGYWVWLIALPDNVMSIGIVADEEIIPFETFRTAELARSWLAANEPQLAAVLQGREMLDFRTMRRYSYPVEDFISADRWALIGDALGFVDPFYSPGGDMISLANLIVVESIRRELLGQLSADSCQGLTSSMRRIQAISTAAIQSIYPCLGASRIAGAHIVLDFLTLVTPMVLVVRNFGAKLYDYLASADAHQVLGELAALRQELNQFMLAWAKEDGAQLAPQSMLDHTEKLHQLTASLWSESADNDLPTLVSRLLAHVQSIAGEYRSHGSAWTFFDPAKVELGQEERQSSG